MVYVLFPIMRPSAYAFPRKLSGSGAPKTLLTGRQGTKMSLTFFSSQKIKQPTPIAIGELMKSYLNNKREVNKSLSLTFFSSQKSKQKVPGYSAFP
ncbi:hypothetical protein Oweho_1441 [Owenweeksia hongkongensis DSM 17368]|uniref:Uncharacterized protein n=1 Tax=Owenweeksia hongkongensis (strain DSM 17368 / CIP 108786 / JCM 12287 / NRRL B-23963 / UST20020801) TaxID=926562 RepID=G8R869_OWEHD|nr:hypothetical protein Oweho_1441 [Owenweeksia hongkongensis DSM 17368]